jgi:predicted HicB family RNase H-like nuclease
MARKMTEAEQAMPRSITVGVRLDPKVRYLAELAARKQRRSLSSFIEWVVQESFGRIFLRERSRN